MAKLRANIDVVAGEMSAPRSRDGVYRMLTHAHQRSFRAVIAALAVIFTMIASLAPANAQRSISFLRDAEIEDWLRDYSNPLFEAAGLEPSAVQIYLIGDPTPNAFVTAGLRVFVHTGLITAAETPNQVEGVMAHETGHLSGGHQQRTGDALATAGRPAIMSLVLGAAIIAAGGPAEAGIAAAGIGQQAAMINFLTYSQGQESSADQAAVDFLEEVGSSGQGLVEFFGILNSRQLRRPRGEREPYMSTHPAPTQRMNRLRERVESAEHFEVKDTEDDFLRLHMIQAKIFGYMQDPQATMRRYPLRDQSKPARYARAVAYYRQSDLDRALGEVNALIEADPENPFFYELKGQMLFEHSRVRESVEPHRKSVEIAPQFALLRINLARSLNALNDPSNVEEAIQVLNIALQMEPQNAFGWTELARAQYAAGNEPMASLAQAQAHYARGDAPNAHRFAMRASQDLEAGTPSHLQALDILAATQQEALRAARRSGGGRAPRR